jgi:CBS domain-containing protein
MTRPAPIVPSHLSMGAARKVAALRSASLLLIEADGRLVGVLDDRALAGAPDADLVEAWRTPLVVAVQPTTTAGRARELLAEHRAACLPVTAGMFVIGTISRERLERALSDPVRIAQRAMRAAA